MEFTLIPMRHIMATSNNIEQAAIKMQDLVKSDLARRIKGANEAKTRLLLIDEILDILGWPKMDFNPEEATSTGGYTDYRLTIDNAPRLIVEAKRIGLVEPLPRSIQNSDYANSFLSSSCGAEMQLLLQQCQSYCIACGLPYAVATTGDIWIIMVGFKYGVEWGKIRSLFFHSLEDIAQRFSEFYGLISREAVENNSLEEKFGSMVLVKPTVAVRPREKIGNLPDIHPVPEKHIIEAFFDRFMGEIIRPGQEKMLEQCYVSNRQLDGFSQDLQHLLTHDLSLEDQDFDIDTVSEEKLGEAIDIQSDAEIPRTILLVGNVGAGKTTFVHRFVTQEARPKRNVCVIVDLINQVQVNVNLDRAEEQRIANRVLEELEKAFAGKIDPFDRDVLRGCFEVEVGRFKKQRKQLFDLNPAQFGIEEETHIFQLAKDKYRHLIGYIKYSKKKKYKTWIAFDNVDRGSDSYQEFVYAFAHRLSAEAGSVTLITLREDTFLEAQEAGFLDVRSSDIIFRIPAPEFQQVVSKRKKYVDRLIRDNSLPKPLRSHGNLIDTLVWHINRLILCDDDFVRYIITTFSLNNMRYGLSMLREYYVSSHSAFHELYRIVISNATGEASDIELNYSKERTRFIQALMLNNTWSYRESTSDVFNVFSVDPLEQTSHFLILRILAYLHLERKIQSARKTVLYEKVRDDFVFLGYPKHHVNNAIRRLIYAGLVVSPNLPANPTTEAKIEVPDPLPREFKISISAKGLCYLQKIVSLPYYQMRVSEDTIWYNEVLAKDYTKCLQEAYSTQRPETDDDLLQATDAREVFLQYLKKALLEEVQSGIVRHSVKEWARVMNDTVERSIFGESITQSVYVSTDSDLVATDEQQPIGTTVVVNPNILKRTTSSNNKEIQQYSFIGESSGIDYEKAIQEAVNSLGSLPKNLKIQGSAYLVRALWALEVASRAGIGALRPVKVAEIIRRYGNILVEPTNVARFFREQKRAGDFTHLWRESPAGHYAINSVGRGKLTSILQSNENMQENSI